MIEVFVRTTDRILINV